MRTSVVGSEAAAGAQRVERTVPRGAVQVASLSELARRGRLGTHQAPRGRAPRIAGVSAVDDPRGRLSMFDDPRFAPPASAGERARWTLELEELPPVLPPVISEPAQSRSARRANSGRHAPQAAAHRTRMRPKRSGVRLTVRGYACAMLIAVAAIAGVSAAAGDQAAPVTEATQVVAAPGESVESVAARTAGGRDVAEVAELIRAANGIAAGALPDAGQILTVPGS